MRHTYELQLHYFSSMYICRLFLFFLFLIVIVLICFLLDGRVFCHRHCTESQIVCRQAKPCTRSNDFFRGQLATRVFFFIRRVVPWTVIVVQSLSSFAVEHFIPFSQLPERILWRYNNENGMRINAGWFNNNYVLLTSTNPALCLLSIVLGPSLHIRCSSLTCHQ